MGIVFSAMISMLSVQHKELKSIKQQLLTMNLKHFILQTMTKTSNCTCHFHQTVSPSAPGPFNIDTTITDEQTSHDINLGSFRSSCDFSSDNNIIVADNQEVKGSSGMTVESVKVNEIRRSGGEVYQGVLTVGFKGRGLVRAIRPIEVDVILTVDSSAGADDTERPIKFCGNESSSGHVLKDAYKANLLESQWALGETKPGDRNGTYVKCPEEYTGMGSYSNGCIFHRYGVTHIRRWYILSVGRIICAYTTNNAGVRIVSSTASCSAICAPIGSSH